MHNLRTKVEDNRIPKVLFDPQMDSDALFAQYGVLRGGVIDLQLMKLASKDGGGEYFPGLGHCLVTGVGLEGEERSRVLAATNKGRELWRPKSGGSMERLNDSPLLQGIIDYCVVDAAYLPKLFEKYNAMLGNKVWPMAVDSQWGNEELKELKKDVFNWHCRALKTSRDRVAKALGPDFAGGTSRNPWYVWYMYRDLEQDIH